MSSAARKRTREAQGKSADAGWPVFRITVGDEEVVVDQNTFTGTERMLFKRTMSRLGYPADNEDRTWGAAWITLRRSDPKLTFETFMDDVTAGEFFSTELVEGDETEDDSPEA